MRTQREFLPVQMYREHHRRRHAFSTVQLGSLGRLDKLPQSFQSTGFSHRRTSTGISHGFTLIELLVVVAVISLLVSILLPSLQSAKEIALDTVCLTQLRGIGTMFYMYANDYEDVIAYYEYNDPDDDTDNVPLFEALDPYKGGTFASGVQVCPTWERDYGELPYNIPQVTTYSQNEANIPYYNDGIARRFGTLPITSASVGLLVDGGPYWDPSRLYVGAAARVVYQDGEYGEWAEIGDFHGGINGGKANFLFADGHAVTIENGAEDEPLMDGSCFD